MIRRLSAQHPNRTLRAFSTTSSSRGPSQGQRGPKFADHLYNMPWMIRGLLLWSPLLGIVNFTYNLEHTYYFGSSVGGGNNNINNNTNNNKSAKEASGWWWNAAFSSSGGGGFTMLKHPFPNSAAQLSEDGKDSLRVLSEAVEAAESGHLKTTVHAWTVKKVVDKSHNDTAVEAAAISPPVAPFSCLKQATLIMAADKNANNNNTTSSSSSAAADKNSKLMKKYYEVDNVWGRTLHIHRDGDAVVGYST